MGGKTKQGKGAAAEPETKKAKTENGASLPPSSSLLDGTNLCKELWKLYENYAESLMASSEDGEGEGDLDEIHELRKRIQESKLLENKKAPKKLELGAIKSCVDMIPILYSVASHILADAAILQVLMDSDNDNKDEKDEKIKKVHESLNDAIQAFPWNAATWSMAANFGRTVLEGQTQSPLISPLVVAHWYNHAVDCAVQVKTQTLALLETLEEEEGEDNRADDEDKALMRQWIEVLLLDVVCGVDWIEVPTEQDDDDEDDDEEEEMMKKTTNGGNQNTTALHGMWSGSTVEATARFTAAMQLSIAEKHDEALAHLKEFSLSHRLHPNVWRVPKALTAKMSKGSDDDSPVVVYQGKDGKGGVLPSDVYRNLCQVFAPEAKYWNESNYMMHGYYSFFMDRTAVNEKMDDKNKRQHSNLVYQVIEDYLLPLAEEQLKKKKTNKDAKENEAAESIVGYEWWVHNRPVGANLGHNLHFDTDEALLKQDADITHPIYSSVLYLTGGGQGGGGPTLVLDQTPESEEVAPRAWAYTPVDNTVLLFPGDMLHGALPCNNTGSSNKEETQNAKQPKIDDLFSAASTSPENVDNLSSHHRLTFMVGFWTRRVPDQMKERKLYGPCGAIPPATEEHTWVQEIEKGVISPETPAPVVECLAVPSVTPAWEEIKDSNEDSMLEIPKAIDHRFFVDGAPQCFLESLVEDHIDMDCEGDDDEEAQGEEDEYYYGSDTCQPCKPVPKGE